MTEPCLTATELPDVLALPDHDPRRRHLATCPRCRALGHAYAEFLDPSSCPDPDLDDADARLARRLSASLQAEMANSRAFGERGDLFAPPGGDDGARRGRRARLAWAGRPAARPALLAAVAVLVACAGILSVRELALQRQARLPAGAAAGAGAVRGAAVDSTQARWERSSAGWRLAWRADQPGEPVLIALDADLRELDRWRLLRPAEPLRPGGLPAGAALVQLTFVAAGDTIARSALLPARPRGP